MAEQLRLLKEKLQEKRARSKIKRGRKLPKGVDPAEYLIKTMQREDEFKREVKARKERAVQKLQAQGDVNANIDDLDDADYIYSSSDDEDSFLERFKPRPVVITTAKRKMYEGWAKQKELRRRSIHNSPIADFTLTSPISAAESTAITAIGMRPMDLESLSISPILKNKKRLTDAGIQEQRQIDILAMATDTSTPVEDVPPDLKEKENVQKPSCSNALMPEPPDSEEKVESRPERAAEVAQKFDFVVPAVPVKKFLNERKEKVENQSEKKAENDENSDLTTPSVVQSEVSKPPETVDIAEKRGKAVENAEISEQNEKSPIVQESEKASSKAQNDLTSPSVVQSETSKQPETFDIAEKIAVENAQICEQNEMEKWPNVQESEKASSKAQNEVVSTPKARKSLAPRSPDVEMSMREQTMVEYSRFGTPINETLGLNRTTFIRAAPLVSGTARKVPVSRRTTILNPADQTVKSTVLSRLNFSDDDDDDGDDDGDVFGDENDDGDVVDDEEVDGNAFDHEDDGDEEVDGEGDVSGDEEDEEEIEEKEETIIRRVTEESTENISNHSESPSAKIDISHDSADNLDTTAESVIQLNKEKTINNTIISDSSESGDDNLFPDEIEQEFDNSDQPSVSSKHRRVILSDSDDDEQLDEVRSPTPPKRRRVTFSDRTLFDRSASAPPDTNENVSVSDDSPNESNSPGECLPFADQSQSSFSDNEPRVKSRRSSVLVRQNDDNEAGTSKHYHLTVGGKTKTHSPHLFLINPTIKKPKGQPTPNVRRSKRNRIRPVPRWMNQNPIYDAEGTLSGVNEVEVHDKEMKKHRTIDYAKICQNEARERRIRQSKNAQDAVKQRKKEKRKDLRKRHAEGLDLSQTSLSD